MANNYSKDQQAKFEAKLKPGDLFRMTYFLGYNVQKQKIGQKKKTTHYFKELKCVGCDRIFRTRFGVQSHMETYHPDLKSTSKASGVTRARNTRPTLAKKPLRKVKNKVANKKPWEEDDINDSDSDIEVLSESSSVENFSGFLSPPEKKKFPKILTSKSMEEEVFEDSENTSTFDSQTADLLSQLEEFNPQLKLIDIYVHNQTDYELPPKIQPRIEEPMVVDLEPTPNVGALFQETPQEKLKKLEKRMQTLNKTPVVQVFTEPITLDDSDLEAEEIQKQPEVQVFADPMTLDDSDVAAEEIQKQSEVQVFADPMTLDDSDVEAEEIQKQPAVQVFADPMTLDDSIDSDVEAEEIQKQPVVQIFADPINLDDSIDLDVEAKEIQNQDPITVEPESAPRIEALFQETAKDKLEKLEKRMQSLNQTSKVQVFADPINLDDSKYSDVEDEEIKTQDSISKTDFIKRMQTRMSPEEIKKSQKVSRKDPFSFKEAFEKVLKKDSSPIIDENLGTSFTSDVTTIPDDDIICLDIS